MGRKSSSRVSEVVIWRINHSSGKSIEREEAQEGDVEYFSWKSESGQMTQTDPSYE